MNRRIFFKDSSLSGAGMPPGVNLFAKDQPEVVVKRSGVMEEIGKFKKIDAHAHIYSSDDSPKVQLDIADRLNIDKLIISHPISEGTPDDFKKCNDLVIRCMKEHPDRFIVVLVISPSHQKESLEEIDRCVEPGMVGMGVLYTYVKINDPLYYLIIEKFIDLNMIVHMHSTIGYYRVKLNAEEPKNISLSENFVEIAYRYPVGMFQYAHIGGGIDRENSCKILKDAPNVYVGVSESNNTASIIDFALKYISGDLLLFGYDNSYYQGVGHRMAAKLTDVQRRKIYFDNYNNILRQSGNHVN